MPVHVDREQVGRAYAYRPRFSREEQAARRMQQVLAATDDRTVALTQFVATLTPEELAELRRVLEVDR